MKIQIEFQPAGEQPDIGALPFSDVFIADQGIRADAAMV